MGQPYLSARVITSRVKTTPSTTNNMRCFILLALIAAASASCVNRVRTNYQQPAVQRSHSSSSTSSSCFHAPQQIYRPQPAPVHAPCYAHATDAPELSFQPQIQAQRPTLPNQLYTKKPSFLAMIQ